MAPSTQITPVIWPVLFRFRKIQWQTKAVYNAVLRVKNEATKFVHHETAKSKLTSELLGLGSAHCRKPRPCKSISCTSQHVTDTMTKFHQPWSSFIFLGLLWRRPRDSRKRRTIQLMRNIPIEADEIESLMNYQVGLLRIKIKQLRH
jgi:hypothetical protein